MGAFIKGSIKAMGNQFVKDKVKTINITIPGASRRRGRTRNRKIESEEEILKKERLKIYFQ